MSKRDSRRKRTTWLRRKELPKKIGKFGLEELIEKVIRCNKSQKPDEVDMIGIDQKYTTERIVVQSK